MLVDLLSLLAVLTLGLLSPGPDFLLVLKNSAGGSRVRAFATVAGIAGGLMVQMTAIAVGFTAVTPAALRMIQLGGAVFLGWVGLRALWAVRGPEAPAASSAVIGRSAFLEGLACNLTNPKAFLFYVSLFAQVAKPDLPLAWRAALPVIFVVHGSVAWCLVALTVQSPPVAGRLARAQRWLPRTFGVALLALAAWVAWQAW